MKSSIIKQTAIASVTALLVVISISQPVLAVDVCGAFSADQASAVREFFIAALLFSVIYTLVDGIIDSIRHVINKRKGQWLYEHDGFKGITLVIFILYGTEFILGNLLLMNVDCLIPF